MENVKLTAQYSDVYPHTLLIFKYGELDISLRELFLHVAQSHLSIEQIKFVSESSSYRFLLYFVVIPQLYPQNCSFFHKFNCIIDLM